MSLRSLQRFVFPRPARPRARGPRYCDGRLREMFGGFDWKEHHPFEPSLRRTKPCEFCGGDVVCPEWWVYTAEPYLNRGDVVAYCVKCSASHTKPIRRDNVGAALAEYELPPKPLCVVCGRELYNGIECPAEHSQSPAIYRAGTPERR